MKIAADVERVAITKVEVSDIDTGSVRMKRAESVEFGLCQCGCGGKTTIAIQDYKARGAIKGLPRRFILGHALRRPPLKATYRTRKARRNGSWTTREHVLVAERALGHALPAGAEVHHVNEDKHDNSPGNLVICQDVAYHRLLHSRARVLRAGGRPGLDRICSYCRLVKPIEEFYRKANGQLSGDCRRCPRPRSTKKRPAELVLELSGEPEKGKRGGR